MRFLLGQNMGSAGKVAVALVYSLRNLSLAPFIYREIHWEVSCRVIPGEVWYKETGVEDKANCVIHQLVIAESLVATLMSNHPDSCAHSPLQARVCQIDICWIPKWWYLSVWLGILQPTEHSIDRGITTHETHLEVPVGGPEERSQPPRSFGIHDLTQAKQGGN